MAIPEKYASYDYQAVDDFMPLSDTNWYYVAKIENTTLQNKDYAIAINLKSYPVEGQGSPLDNKLILEVTSYENDSFRVRFNPRAETFADYRDNVFGPVTKQQLDWIKQQEGKSDLIAVDPETQDITITLKQVAVNINADPFMIKVTRLRDGTILHEDGICRHPDSKLASQGILFVNPNLGSATAALKTKPKEARYYGCGEVYSYREVYDDDKRYHTSDLEHTGQMVTFFHYDDLNYHQGELDPTNGQLPQGTTDYYYPMYFGGSFAIERNEEFAYGIFLDNTSQTYFNFSDTTYPSNGTNQPSGNFENCYFFGAQYGELDYHLVFGDSRPEGPGSVASVLDRFTYILGKENENPKALNLRGVMPPKYIFGYFQGVFGLAGLLKPEDTESDEDGSRGDDLIPIYVDELVADYRNDGFPLEGLAIDVDVQDDLCVFTTNGAFWSGGVVGQGKSVFEWAHDHDLVCQTNITCFIRSNVPQYGIYNTLAEGQYYTKRDTAEGYLSDNDLPWDGHSPRDAYNGFLDYGGGETSPALFPDFGRKATRDWWGRNYYDPAHCEAGQIPLFEQGLDFVWQDMTVPAMAPHVLGEELEKSASVDDFMDNLSDDKFNWKSYHPQVMFSDPRYGNEDEKAPLIELRNLHAYIECKATYEQGLLARPKNKNTKYDRSYIISRGGYIGLQHFGGVWTGDNGTAWPYLQIMVPMVMNMGLCGVPITGSDVGGFVADSGTEAPNPILMTRWVQAGCLLPWFRNHYDRYTQKKQQGKYYQELYMYQAKPDATQAGESFADIMRHYVKLRVRWHQLLYDGMYEFVQTGLPIIKPTCLFDGGGTTGKNDLFGFERKQNDQFFLGHYDVLVAPAIAEAVEIDPLGAVINHRVWLPNGYKWFPYHAATDRPADRALKSNGKVFGYLEGLGELDYFDIMIDTLPLFIREGAIIPTRMAGDGSVKNIQQFDDVDDPFVFDLWPGKANSYRAYFDDGGVTRNAETQDDYTAYLIQQDSTQPNRWTIHFTWQNGQREIDYFLYARLRASNPPASIEDSQNSSFTRINSLQALFDDDAMGYFYDAENQELWVKFKGLWDADQTYALQVNYLDTPYTISELPFAGEPEQEFQRGWRSQF